MRTFPYKKILFLNIAGAILFFSYAWSGLDGPWARLDEKIFRFFNHLIAENPFLREVIAVSNLRMFDVIILLSMGAIYGWYFARGNAPYRRNLICIGLVMLLSAVVLKVGAQKIMLFEHPSPTLYFEGVHRLSELSALSPKDAAGNSFPGDHGLMLLVFAGFAARYLGGTAFILALLVAVIFSLPRVAAGAHWSSDILVGSVGYSLLMLPWLLLTPLSDKLAGFFDRILPKWLFSGS